MSGRLVVLCGLPGAGKTTLAVELERRHDAVRLDADAWLRVLDADLRDGPCHARVERLQWELAQRLLALGQTVVVEWGSWERAGRDRLRHRARELGARVELRYLAPSFETRWERVRAREDEQPLTLHELRAYDEAFEAPDADELALYDAG